jgi:hypothetical protein
LFLRLVAASLGFLGALVKSIGRLPRLGHFARSVHRET